MTTEEALNECKRIREDIESDIYLEYYNNTEELKNHHLDVIDTVIAALEKRTPIRPIDGMSCPCGRTVVDRWGTYKFCPRCGQAFDWRNESGNQ